LVDRPHPGFPLVSSLTSKGSSGARWMSLPKPHSIRSFENAFLGKPFRCEANHDMNRGIPERDWKVWRKLSPVVLERFCARVLEKAATFESGTGSAHSRYLRLYRYIRESDKSIAAVFNDQRRSSAYPQIAVAVREGIVTREELGTFSEDTQDVIKVFLGEA
jgi:hypothetical protein